MLFEQATRRVVRDKNGATCTTEPTRCAQWGVLRDWVCSVTLTRGSQSLYRQKLCSSSSSRVTKPSLFHLLISVRLEGCWGSRLALWKPLFASSCSHSCISIEAKGILVQYAHESKLITGPVSVQLWHYESTCTWRHLTATDTNVVWLDKYDISKSWKRFGPDYSIPACMKVLCVQYSK